MYENKLFKPTKQKKTKKKVFGFDIETYSQKNKFYCASLYSDDLKEPYRKYFFNVDDLLKEIKTKKFYNSFIVATNMSFDYFGLLFGHQEIQKFRWQFRGSEMIFAKTFILDSEFYHKSIKEGKKAKGSVTFVDTLNYAKISVKNIGKILNTEKLIKPKALGKIPKNEEEKQELLIYNMRDSELSYKFLKFLFNTFIELGGTPKLTIASSAMSLFKNKYLSKNYFVHDKETLLKIFKSYYGGRTETFSRGFIKDYFYYDFNSLYPSVMLNKMPDPNYIRRIRLNNLSHIRTYEGFSDVEIFCPRNMRYPLLPYRFTNKSKLLFPSGRFRGWYSHIELRYAIKLGYKIKRVHETLYFTRTCKPFNNYVKDLYSLRQKYKAEDNVMEYVVKLLLNSLYGKFAQKFEDRDNWVPEEAITMEELEKYDDYDRIGNFFRVKNDLVEPASFCFPEWASYITAYGRIKLHKAIVKMNPVYVDTDSLITKTQTKSSDKLGDLKLEMYIKRGYVIKPKFYAFQGTSPKGKDKDYIKIKGVSQRLFFDNEKDPRNIKYKDFCKIISKKELKVAYNKFIKFKEALRRDLVPNEILKVEKNLNKEDNKRIWKNKFNYSELEESTAISL